MCLHINPKSDLDLAWKELEQLGLQILYSSENDDGLKVIYANMENELDISKNQHITFTETFTLPETDWVQQFKDHGLNFHDGMVHVDLRDFGCSNPLFNPIKLNPGPGFGDLSHPTTNLVLKLMRNHCKKRNVLDIGCGSGILSLAAVSMASASSFGIDIDSDAIHHSHINAELNGMEGLVSFGMASDYQPPENEHSLLIMMNMIQSEQLEAWSSVKSIHHLITDSLISGILKEGRKHYLKWTKSLNWKLISEIEEDGWLAFHFSCS